MQSYVRPVDAAIKPLATMRSAMPIALSILRAPRRTESDGLIGIEMLSLGFITLWHLAVYPGAETPEFLNITPSLWRQVLGRFHL